MASTKINTEALKTAIATRNPSCPAEVLADAVKLAILVDITIEDIEGENGEALVSGLTDDAHNRIG